MANADPKQIVQVLIDNYSTNELEKMCFNIDIDYEDLGGQGKSGKARELVQFADRRGRLGEVVAYVRETRPQVSLEGSSTASTTAPASAQPQQPVVQEVHNYYGNVNQRGDVTTTTTTNQGDTFNMSGDFRGANLNVKSTLTHVNQTIGALPKADDTAKAELQQLIVQLNEALQQAPADKAEEADAVVQMTEALVETANSEKPNKMIMEITGEGLKKAAANLAGIVPDVVKIAGAIVTGILGLG